MNCIPVVCAPPRYSIISSLSSKWPGSIPFCLIWFSLSWTFKINVRHICSNFLFRCSVASCRFCLAVNFRMYSTDAFKIVPLFHLWSLKFFNVKIQWCTSGGKKCQITTLQMPGWRMSTSSCLYSCTSYPLTHEFWRFLIKSASGLWWKTCFCTSASQHMPS